MYFVLCLEVRAFMISTYLLTKYTCIIECFRAVCECILVMSLLASSIGPPDVPATLSLKTYPCDLYARIVVPEDKYNLLTGAPVKAASI